MTDSRKELVERVIEACADIVDRSNPLAPLKAVARDIRRLDRSNFDEPAAPQAAPQPEKAKADSGPAVAAAPAPDNRFPRGSHGLTAEQLQDKYAESAAPAQETGTPRTDAELKRIYGGIPMMDLAWRDFPISFPGQIATLARTLERELAAAREENKQAWKKFDEERGRRIDAESKLREAKSTPQSQLRESQIDKIDM